MMQGQADFALLAIVVLDMMVPDCGGLWGSDAAMREQRALLDAERRLCLTGSTALAGSGKGLAEVRGACLL